LFASLAALGLTASGSLAQYSQPAPLAQDAAKAKTVKMKGTLACLGCDLKKAYGAGAQCSVYGHKHALKTANGKYYTFLENQKSEPLIKGEQLHGKSIQVTGSLFPRSQVIEVTDYKVLEQKADNR
jgi:hypothetical protein